MKNGRILVLEATDTVSPMNERSVKDKLRNWGHEVIQRHCGDDLVAEMARVEPHLVYVQSDDSHHEHMLECVKQIRSLAPYKNTPLLVQLADRQLDRKAVYFEAGVSDCLIQPVTDTEMRQRVEQLLRLVDLKEKLDQSRKALEESMYKINRQRTELDHHLTLAARIQEALIPSNLIQVPFCNFYCHFQPSGRVGGDIYDIFMLDDRHMGLYTVDVMGHGVASSMLAVALSEFLVLDVNRGTPLKREMEEPPYYEIVPPIEVIRYLNKRFTFSKYQHYFTIFYMVFNVEDGTLRYVRGAHPEPVLMRKTGAIETLNAYGTPVGFEFSQGYEECRIQMNPGDRLLIYSDGLLELEEDNGETVGYDRLINMAAAYMKEDHRRPFAMQFKQMAEKQSRLKDDLTMIELVWNPA